MNQQNIKTKILKEYTNSKNSGLITRNQLSYLFNLIKKKGNKDDMLINLALLTSGQASLLIETFQGKENTNQIKRGLKTELDPIINFCLIPNYKTFKASFSYYKKENSYLNFHWFEFLKKELNEIKYEAEDCKLRIEYNEPSNDFKIFCKWISSNEVEVNAVSNILNRMMIFEIVKAVALKYIDEKSQ